MSRGRFHQVRVAGGVQLDLFRPVVDEPSAWLDAYWAGVRPIRGRFKAMTAGRSAGAGRGFRQDVPVTRPVCLTGETR